MFRLFTKQKSYPKFYEFSSLHTDMHSHLIPSVDDGAEDMDNAIDLVKAMLELGYKKIITTPHIKSEGYENNRKNLQEGLVALKKALKAAGLDIDIHCAAEYYMDDAFEKLLHSEPPLTVKDSKVLVEISFLAPPPQLHHYLFQLQTKGYQPILAHPERYLYYKDDFDKYYRLKELGCTLQLNLLSLTGYYGKPVRDNAVKLMKSNLIDYLGTDMHNLHHAIVLKEAQSDSRIIKMIYDYPFQNSNL